MKGRKMTDMDMSDIRAMDVRRVARARLEYRKRQRKLHVRIAALMRELQDVDIELDWSEGEFSSALALVEERVECGDCQKFIEDAVGGSLQLDADSPECAECLACDEDHCVCEGEGEGSWS